MTVFSVIALGMTGCATTEVSLGDSGLNDFVCDATGGPVVDLLEVEPALDTSPETHFPSPLKSLDQEFRFITKGTGPAITINQTVSTRLSIYNGKDGSLLYDGNHIDMNTSPLFLLVNENTLVGSQFQSIFGPLLCTTEGSRIAVTAPAEDVFEQDIRESYALSGNDSIVFIVDVLGSFLEKAQGTDLIVTNNELPSVSFAVDGTPGLTFRGNKAPDDVVVQMLKNGNGETIGTDSNIVMQFTTWSWNDRRVIDTTWTTKSPGQLLLGNDSNPLLPDSAVIGKKVGSQLMVVTPAEDQDDAKIIVVDIIGIFE